MGKTYKQRRKQQEYRYGYRKQYLLFRKQNTDEDSIYRVWPGRLGSKCGEEEKIIPTEGVVRTKIWYMKAF